VNQTQPADHRQLAASRVRQLNTRVYRPIAGERYNPSEEGPNKEIPDEKK
jgi:hypothetical protein